jgi:hypothetical protein
MIEHLLWFRARSSASSEISGEGSVAIRDALCKAGKTGLDSGPDSRSGAKQTRPEQGETRQDGERAENAAAEWQGGRSRSNGGTSRNISS